MKPHKAHTQIKYKLNKMNLLPAMASAGCQTWMLTKPEIFLPYILSH